MNFEPLLHTTNAWTAIYDRIAVHIFEGQVSVSEMDRMQAVGERWTAQHPGKRVEIAIILPSSARLNSDERSRMARLIKHGEAHRAASATVIEADGLLGAMQRSMLTGMMMIAPAPHPARVFGKVPDALVWLEPYARNVCSPDASFEALRSALEQYVKKFRERPERRG
jgi:hypothetical protein